jgi:chromosome segregation ATPase
MIINLITVAACFLMLVMFRRFDQANLRMAKLRRYSSRVFDDFKKMSEKENRKFQDATIEIDILIKKSNALAKNMAESIIEIENRLKGLDVEKTNLKKVDEDIKIISGAAKDLNKQIQFIASAKENFGDIAKKVTYLSENVDNINSQMGHITNTFEDKLRERSREISEEFYLHADNLKSDLERRENELVVSSKERMFQLSEEFSRNVNEMEKRVNDSSEVLYENFKIRINPLVKVVENADTLGTQIQNMRDTFAYMENTFFDEFKQKSKELKTDINDNIDKLNQKIKNVETNIDESKSKLIGTFENEVEKVRTELDNLSIHAVSKKDEIVQAARREAEGIRKKIEEFEDRFVELETRIIETAEGKLDSIDSEYQSIELRLNTLMGRIKDEEGGLSRRLSDIKEEIIKYEQNNDIFGKTDQLMKKVDTAVSQLNRTLEDAQKESKELEKFVADIDQIKELKKTADKEIRTYYAKKEKLADIEGEVRNLMEVNDHVLDKTDKLLESISKVDAVNSRIDSLSDAYSAVERRINELREYEDIISRNLDAVNKSDLIIQTIDSRIKAFEKIIDRSDKRVEKIGLNLKRVEEETIILRTKENDMRDLRDRLSELDGLSDHMEERIKQIHAMFQKVETIRKEIDVTDSRLQDMFSQTDRKMKEFSDFIQAVDNNNPILKQVKADVKGSMPGKNLNDNIIKTVRELSGKGWEPEAISKKLMLDENSVRFIINTTLL